MHFIMSKGDPARSEKFVLQTQLKTHPHHVQDLPLPLCLQVLRVQDGGNGGCGTCAVVGHCHQKHEGEAKEVSAIFRYLE